MTAADQVAAIERAGPLRRALDLWYPLMGGILAWTVHLLFVASWAPYACRSGTRWPMHVATGATAVVAIGAGALSFRLIRLGRDSDNGSTSAAGRLHFLGAISVLVNIISLALILLEGLYAAVLHGCG